MVQFATYASVLADANKSEREQLHRTELELVERENQVRTEMTLEMDTQLEHMMKSAAEQRVVLAGRIMASKMKGAAALSTATSKHQGEVNRFQTDCNQCWSSMGREGGGVLCMGLHRSAIASVCCVSVGR